MALSTCTVTGTIYYSDGSPAVGEVIRVIKVIKSGKLISTGIVTSDPADSNGLVTFTIARDSTAYVWADVVGFNTNAATGIALVIPDASSCTLESVAPATSVPNTVPVAIAGGGYIHTQTPAALTWTINHNMAQRPSVVQCFDTAYAEMEGQVTHPTANQTVIVFTVSVDGYARLI